MDNKQLQDVIEEPSAMEMFRESQARLAELSCNTGSTDGLLKIAQNLDTVKKLAGHIASQDLLSQLSESFPYNNIALGATAIKTMKELAGSPTFNSSVFESLEVNKSFIDIVEATNLGLKPQPQFILPEGFTSKTQIGDLSSVISKATEVFRQLESLSSLDSLEALSKIKNLPTDTELDKASNTNFERPRATLAEVERLDAKISTEVSNTHDFNELSEETQRNSNLFLKNYRLLVMNLVVSLYLIEDFLDEDLDLSRKSFTIADNVEEVITNIGQYWNGNKVALLNSFIVTQVNKIISFILS